MKGNPFLKADDKTLRINGNTANLIFTDVSRSFDENTGEITIDATENVVSVPISAPHAVNEHVVDGKNFISGDIRFEISRLALEKALPSGRNPDMMSCGVSKEKDKVKMGTVTYSIVRIEPVNIYNNIPSRYKFHLRSA